MPARVNPLFTLVQILCFFIILWAYIPMPAYIFILEKEENEEWKEAVIKQAEQTEKQLLIDNNSNAE